MFHACETRGACKTVPQSREVIWEHGSLLWLSFLPPSNNTLLTIPYHKYLSAAHTSSFIRFSLPWIFFSHPSLHLHLHHLTPSPPHPLTPSPSHHLTFLPPHHLTPSPLSPHLYPFPFPTGSQRSWTEHQWSGRW